MTVAFLEQVAITCRSTWSYSNFNNSRIAQILQQRNYANNAMVRLPTNKQLLRPIFCPNSSVTHVYPYRAETTLLVSIHPLGYYVYSHTCACMHQQLLVCMYRFR